MKADKPSLPKGTRDFGPETMRKRNDIFGVIKNVFEKFGFEPLETPAMENLSVLMGKYGDEGDQLIFKILNSGDYLQSVSDENLVGKNAKALIKHISEKALRYDLTIPFARYVVMNRNELSFPFRRYQIQPVWRADRPQKSRYREFHQCDADVIGTDSLICEAEIVLMIDEVLSTLGVKDFTIKINNRKILSGLAEIVGEKERETEIFVAIDKLDKIGREGVLKELSERGIAQEPAERLLELFQTTGDNQEKINILSEYLKNSETGSKGLSELNELLHLLEGFRFYSEKLEIDPGLARGLSYYTGTIFEVKVNNVQVGSISGGGRYDNLTGIFGLPDVSGVGFSFGVDRIYDVMEELGLFSGKQFSNTQVLICAMGPNELDYSLALLRLVREAGIHAEIYPDITKLKKQLAYADSKKIKQVAIIGETEVKENKITLKNMATGQQDKVTSYQLIKRLSRN